MNDVTETLRKCTFIVACREYFGIRPGQQLQEFAAEIRALTPQDKAELTVMFRDVGFDATKSV